MGDMGNRLVGQSASEDRSVRRVSAVPLFG